MQKIDKLAIVVVAALILFTVIWSIVSPDPGVQTADAIREHADEIDETTGKQGAVDLGRPENAGDRVEAIFRPATAGQFPEWSFYRRRAEFVVQEVVERKPPALTSGQVCKVESIREKGEPNRTFQRVRGVRAKAERATVTREALERRVGTDGEWTEVAPLPAGDEFELDLVEGLERGASYAYRVTVEAKSENDLEFPEGGLSVTLHSDPSEPMLFPEERTMEFSGLVPGSIIDGVFQPGKATVVLYRWNWGKMKVDRTPAVVTEGEPLFDTGYTVDQGGVRQDATPPELKLSGTGLPRLTLEKGVKPLPLDPPAWESEHPACTGAGAKDEGATGATPPAEEAPPKPKPAEGGLFGDD